MKRLDLSDHLADLVADVLRDHVADIKSGGTSYGTPDDNAETVADLKGVITRLEQVSND